MQQVFRRSGKFETRVREAFRFTRKFITSVREAFRFTRKFITRVRQVFGKVRKFLARVRQAFGKTSEAVGKYSFLKKNKTVSIDFKTRKAVLKLMRTAFNSVLENYFTIILATATPVSDFN